ncbi:MSHA pilin protein MshD [hydrothermal vent metagenome]|uniref:MSHA pilin protein MshD n=1 Tax=hydrothermal vent metagenome TaxID=652676 RepID=A0A3B1AQA3_9ZZZZ
MRIFKTSLKGRVRSEEETRTRFFSSLATRHSSLNVTGVTLIEMVIFIVIVGIAVTAVLSVYINVGRTGADPLVRIRGIELGQSMIEEILLKAYDHSTPLGGGCVQFSANSRCTSGTSASAESAADFDDGESRDTFNDVDDYHNIAYCGDNVTAADAACSTACTPMLDDAGNNIATEYAGYAICIQVSFAGGEMNNTTPADVSVLANDGKRIDVIVTDHLNSRYQLSAYRLNF